MSFPSVSVRRGTSRFFIYAIGFMASVSGFAGYAGTAQKDKDEADARSQVAIMQALLSEVRQLRQAVERLSAVNGRVQIALQEMQLQEHRLSQASGQLADIHKWISALSSRRTEIANRLTALEAKVNDEHDPVSLRALEETQAALKMEMEGLSAQEAQVQAEEADANAVVQSEQNKCQDLRDQLSALVRSLGADSAGATSKERRVDR